MPTAHANKWREATNVTTDDTTGKCEKTSGAAGSFNASARVGQMFDGRSDVVVEATIGAIGEMALGIYAASTTYSRGAVTVASLLAAWHIDAANNAIVKESGTTRFTQAGAANGDTVKIELTAAGALKYYFKPAAGAYSLVHTSAIATSTVLGWRPWRVVVTHSASNSKFDPTQLTGEDAEYHDPDTAANHGVHESPFGPEFDIEEPEYAVHVNDNQSGEAGPGSEQPYSRAIVM